jgi:hypothetical protein
MKTGPEISAGRPNVRPGGKIIRLSKKSGLNELLIFLISSFKGATVILLQTLSFSESFALVYARPQAALNGIY